MTTGITSILKNILKFITFIGAVVVAVFLLRAFVIEPFVVPTGSMESTIEVGDCILAQKITLETGSDLKPGDIVVFKNPRPRMNTTPVSQPSRLGIHAMRNKEA